MSMIRSRWNSRPVYPGRVTCPAGQALEEVGSSRDLLCTLGEETGTSRVKELGPAWRACDIVVACMQCVPTADVRCVRGWNSPLERSFAGD